MILWSAVGDVSVRQFTLAEVLPGAIQIIFVIRHTRTLWIGLCDLSLFDGILGIDLI